MCGAGGPWRGRRVHSISRSTRRRRADRDTNRASGQTRCRGNRVPSKRPTAGASSTTSTPIPICVHRWLPRGASTRSSGLSIFSCANSSQAADVDGVRAMMLLHHKSLLRTRGPKHRQSSRRGCWLSKKSFLETPAALGDMVPRNLKGQQLGPYHLESTIGAGGIGEVYRGRDTRLNRIVAIKVLPLRVVGRPIAVRSSPRSARANPTWGYWREWSQEVDERGAPAHIDADSSSASGPCGRAFAWLDTMARTAVRHNRRSVQAVSGCPVGQQIRMT